MGFIAMAIIGVNIQALLIGLGSLVVSFAFMIGPASSKYLEVIFLMRVPAGIMCESVGQLTFIASFVYYYYLQP